MSKITRAVLSVTDKTGIVAFAKGLEALGVEILSTGGTARALKEGGVTVKEIGAFTGFPEIMDGRVKTLHPKVHGGILAMRDNPEHVAAMKKHAIEPIDMVCVNLYAFEKTVAKADVTLADAIENIDIGGPTMLRSAAKNHAHVAVVTEPGDYDAILAEMKANGGALSAERHFALAVKVFKKTAAYDAAISTYLSKHLAAGGATPFRAAAMEKVQDCRYGENPHQAGALYRDLNAAEPGLPSAIQHHGKELSFNNILDLAAALRIVREFEEPACVVIKHNNPCGCACAATLADALTEAWLGDPMSAFGSVISFNRTVDKETASRLGSTKYLKEVIVPRYQEESGDTETVILAAFVEAVIAPGYEPEALEILKKKANLRIMELKDFKPAGTPAPDVRPVPGGFLVQDADTARAPRSDFKVVTKKAPNEEQIESLVFADAVAKHVKSNAIVLVKGKTLVGCGAGQMSRFDSTLIAARKAGKRAEGAVLASDAMFPAPDGLEAAAETGAVAVIQPGGSKRDADVIAAADARGIPMVCTGMRHFLH